MNFRPTSLVPGRSAFTDSAGVLSTQLNGRWWRTDEANSELNWLPHEWRDAGANEQINVIVQVNTAGDELEVTYAGRTVVYTPTELTDEDYCCGRSVNVAIGDQRMSRLMGAGSS